MKGTNVSEYIKSSHLTWQLTIAMDSVSGHSGEIVQNHVEMEHRKGPGLACPAKKEKATALDA